MSMSFDKTSKVDPKAVQAIRDSIESEFGPSLTERREALQTRFGDMPIPRDVIETTLTKYAPNDPYFRGLLIKDLAEIRGTEMLPWVEQLLESKDLNLAGWGALALLDLADPRAFQEIERLHQQHLGKDENCKFPVGWLVGELIEHNRPESLALAEKLMNNSRRFYSDKKTGT